jgi:3-oxoacyl-[acyl-carrier protein] reductase
MTHDLKLAGKVAIVTGGAKGIGAGIAVALAREGAAVVVNYASSKAAALAVVAMIMGEGGRATAVKADVSDPAQAAGLVEETIRLYGRLDVLVNNAGVYEFLPLEKITPAHFHKHFDLNVLGLILMTQAAAARFGDKGGSVVNISSVASTLAAGGASVYSASKAAVDAVTRSLAKELGARNIRVNAVNPAIVETPGTKVSGLLESDFREAFVKQVPLGRIGQVEDVAPAVVYFASDESKWVTGATLPITGGFR